MNTDNYLENLQHSHLRFVVEPDGGSVLAPPDPVKFMSDSTDVVEIPPVVVDDNPPPPPVKKEDTTPPPPPVKKEDTTPPPTGDYKPADIWDVAKEELSTPEKPWDIPEILKTGKKEDGTPLTKKEEFALLRKTIADNTSFDDELVNEWIEAKNSGATQDQFLQTKSKQLEYSKLSVDDKVRMNYEMYAKANKLDWTKDKIDAQMSKLSDVEKDMQAKNFDNYMQGEQQRQAKLQIDTFNSKFETNYNKAETDNNQLVINYLKNIEGKNVVSGIEFSEAEMTQYKKDISTFMKREVKTDEKTGMKYAISQAEELLSKILAKPESTFDLLPYLYMVKNNTLKGYSNRLKENIKKNLEKTLDPEPDINTSRSGVSGPNAQKFMAD